MRKVIVSVGIAGFSACSMWTPQPAVAAAWSCDHLKAQVPLVEALVVPRAICDLSGLTLHGSGLSAEVPTNGTAVIASALRADGSEQIEVMTALDGNSWTISRRGTPPDEIVASSETVPGVDPPSSAMACRDNYYEAALHRTSASIGWKFNEQYEPTYIVGNAQSEFAQGISNMTRGVTDCGPAPETAAYATYAGTTTTRPTIRGDMGACLATDALNVVAWGSAAGSANLAVNCTYKNTANNFVFGTDTQFNSAKNWDNVASDGCAYRNGNPSFDLEAVMTHEWGHSVGMRDLGAGHEDLTMFESIGACTIKARTLGSGDRQFMINAYGYR